MASPLVLVVDDEPDLVELVSLTLSRMQLATQSAGDVASAKKLLKSQDFDLCLTDMRLPDGDGLDLLEWMGTNCPKVPCAVITAHGNVESAVRALKLGAFDFVSKPLDLGVLRRIVSTALKLSQSADEEATTRTGTHLIGNTQTMERLRELIQRVARSQAPVHISGESGTGKELVARMIHGSGPRAEGPFVPVNCGAIPSELMESEFFGHKRGSFTGAVTDKVGLIPSAEGGTLFLDEVADLPLHMQVKLLRVIQEKSVRPIGEQREAPVDVRILSATHKNLGELVANAKFREDLFYRINVIELRVPPLRERAEDIPDLADNIVRRLSRRLGAEPPVISPEALTCCRALRFPETCANSRTCWSGHWRCATTGASRRAICSCARCRGRTFPSLRQPPSRQCAAHRLPATPRKNRGRRARSATSSRTWNERPSSRHWKRLAITRLLRRRRWA